MKKTWKVLSLVFLAILVAIGSLFAFGHSATSNRAKTIQANKKSTTSTKKLCDKIEDVISNRYNISIRESDTAVTVVVKPSSMGDPETKRALSKIKLYVSSIERVDSRGSGKVEFGTDYTVSKGHNAVIPISKFESLVKNQGDVDLRFNFVAAEEDADPICKGKVRFSVRIETSFDVIGDIPLDEQETGELTDVDSETLEYERQLENVTIDNSVGVVDCSNPIDDFSRDYCSNGAIVVPANANKEVVNFSDVKNTRELKCAWKYNVNGRDTIPTVKYSDNSNEYFSNVSYFETTKEENMPSAGKYQYNFNPSEEPKEETINACKTECTETVKVEYGPPVASKAGLCFEYVVRVTSNVKCSVSSKPQKPKTYRVCTPKPACVHTYKNKKPRTGVNAGPDEEFDKCIKACDGGKYTRACSKKCYDAIYGGSSKSSSSSVASRYNDIIASKIDYGRCDNYEKAIDKCHCLERVHDKGFTVNNYDNNRTMYGCYYKENGKYLWKGYNAGTEAGERVPGRYYKYITYWNYDESNYTVYTEGFFRRTHDDDVCDADCSWKQNNCTSNTYLNPGWKKEDKERNLAKYREAVKSCITAAKCSSTRTTFKIKITDNPSADGTGGKAEDTLVSEDNNSCDAHGPSIDDLNYLLEYKGCYKNCISNKGIYYRGTWSFPGSWLNYKTGEVSYTNKGTGWKEYSNKYCIPLNAKNVNTKWWNYYYTLKFGDSNVAINSGAFQNECNKGGTGKSCNYKVYSVNESDIKYNILAETRNFGHFKWNFDIKCFYALNTNICDPDGSGSGNTDSKCTGGLQKSIRTVDLADMFPNKDGATHDSSTSGRDPGFNWSQYSSYAAVGSDKTDSYLGQPQEYMKWVQTLGDNVYNDRYLDYQVRLSKNDINTIKNKIKNGLVYSNFQDGSRGNVDVNSVVNYRSNLLRSDLSGKTTFPTDDALKCNNMKNHSGGCEDLSRVEIP